MCPFLHGFPLPAWCAAQDPIWSYPSHHPPKIWNVSVQFVTSKDLHSSQTMDQVQQKNGIQP